MATVAVISVSSNLAGDHAMTICNLSFQYMCDWLLQVGPEQRLYKNKLVVTETVNQDVALG